MGQFRAGRAPYGEDRWRGAGRAAATFEGMRVAWASLVVLIGVCYAAAVVIPGMAALGGLLKRSMDYYSS